MVAQSIRVLANPCQANAVFAVKHSTMYVQGQFIRGKTVAGCRLWERVVRPAREVPAVRNLHPKPIPEGPPALPGSLAAALAVLPDPRRPDGWRPDRAPLPLIGILHLAAAAIRCGARSLSAVAQWGRERVEDDPETLVPLGVPVGRSPRAATRHRVFKARDLAAFERANRGPIRSGAAPRAVASCRNLAIGLLRRRGVANIAAALRTDAGRLASAIRLVVASPMR